MIEKYQNTSIYLLALGIGLGLLCFFYIDPYISKLCMGVSYPLRNYLKWVSRILSPPFHIAFWSIVYLTAKYSRKSHKLLSISREIVYSLLISLPLVYCMKILLGRARPELLADGIYGFYFVMKNHHYHSFPSGHAAVATCLFTPLFRNFLKFQIAWVILPLFLSSSRILLNYHYTSDILASGMICYILQELYRKYRDKKKRKSDLYNPIS